MKKLYKNISALIIMMSFGSLMGQQLYVNEEWEITNGTLGQYKQVSSTIDADGNLVTISNHKPNNNSDIHLKCIHPDGNIIWQQICPSSPNNDDYGIDVKTDQTGNVFVAGAKHNGSNFDYLIAKYTQSGSLLWQQTYNGPGNSDDVPSAIIVDSQGDAYVTGSSYGSNSMTDFATLKLEGSSGNIIWSSRYNFNNKPEVAVDLKLDNLGNVLVCGGSAQNFFNSVFTLVKYDGNNGSQIGVKRHNTPGNGFDLPSGMVVDNNNNIYVTGTTKINQSDKDIKLIAYNSNLQVLWVEYFDKSGNADESHGITLSPNNNEVLITGHCTKSNGGTNAIIGKYSTLNGNQSLWIERSANIDIETCKAQKIATTSNGNIYITGEMDVNGSRNIMTTSYDNNGDLRWEKTFNNLSNGIDRGSKIEVNDDNVFVTGVSEINGEENTVTIRYTEREKPIDLSNEVYNANELLIRFDSSAIIYPTIDRVGFEAGILQDFVKPAVLQEMATKTGFDWGRLSTFKIFRRMTTADSVSVTRLGVTHRIDDFWATLSVYLPNEMNEKEVADSLNTMYPTIHYADLNFIGQLFDEPNDDLYIDEQSGLFDPAHGIEVEDAWDKQVGQQITKVGVFDSGVNWRHEDFGDGTWVGSKIEGGWDYHNNVSPESQTLPDEDGHGTAVAGIIGALRDNNLGIAGVAGGDMIEGNTGCQLFTMRIPADVPLFPNEVIPILHSTAAPAIVEGAVHNPPSGYGYGLHIQNHSWGGTQSSNILRDAVKTCYEESCIFVAASGNDGDQTINYPATYNDEWVLKIGANDVTGNRANFSTFNNDLDVIAPGTNDIYSSLDHDDNTGYTYNGDGTSFASPNVAGVIALFHSEHNINNGYPNDLAPEDVEYFLENFATSPFQGFDQEIGFGRVNADLSLDRLSFPQFFVQHSGGQSTPIQTIASGQSVIVNSNMNGVAAGNYIADRYQITYTFVDILANDQTVIDDWERFSSSVGVSAANPITGETWFTYTSTINQNVASVTATTFCWYILSDLSGQTINKWIPAPPQDLRTSYSLYVEDANSDASTEESRMDYEFNLFPNPSENQVTIEYKLAKNTNVNLEIRDVTGRIIAIHDFNNQDSGYQSMTINVSNLSNGMYLCNLNIGEEIISKKIIKK